MVILRLPRNLKPRTKLFVRPIVEVSNTEITYSWESDFSLVKIFGLKLVEFVDDVGVF